MAKPRFKIVNIEQHANRSGNYNISLLIKTKVHNIDCEICLELVVVEKLISVTSIGVTKGSYNLLARAFLLKDANELHNGFQRLTFRINNPTILVKESMLSVTWEQFADRFAEWMRQYMLNKLGNIINPVKELLK